MQLTPSFINNQLAFRGIASFWVFMGHLLFGAVYNAGFASYEGWGWIGQVMILHFLAVDGFFVLSGCLLTFRYWDGFTKETSGAQIDRFYLIRLARLYPLHLLGCLIIGIYALIGVPHPISSGLQDVLFEHWQWSLALNLAGMQAWGIVPVASWNEPAWTVSAMVFIYILFPNLVLMLRRVPEQLYGWLIVVLVLGYYALRQSVELGSNSDGAGALARALVFFVIGMCVARIYVSGRLQAFAWNRLFNLVLLSFVVGIWLWWRLGPFDMVWFHVWSVALMLCLLYADGVSAQWFANKVCRWLGEISYALFILHYPILLGIKAALGEWLAALHGASIVGAVIAYSLTITLVLGLSYLACRYVERPLNARLKTYLNTERSEQK